MDDIKVSVGCLAYNHEKYIRDALDGFVKQKTNFKYEVIIHDDASTDNTANIIREYEKKYPDIIKPIYQKENQFSKGINIFEEYISKRTNGKYFALCEGDDYWTDEYKLQKQYDALINNLDCCICVHRVNICDEDGNFVGSSIPNEKLRINKTQIIKGEEIIKYMLGTEYFSLYPFQTSSYFLKADAFRNIKGKIKLDAEVLMNMADVGNFYYYDEVMSCYRVNRSSSTGKIKEAGLERIAASNLFLMKRIAEFDKSTKNKYHDYVTNNLNFQIAGCIPVFTDEVIEFMKENDINFFSILKNTNFKNSLKYLIKRYFNFIFKLFKKNEEKNK